MMTRLSISPSESETVFRDLGFSDLEAENLKVRAFMMLEIERLIRARGLTQTEAAELLGVAQPRISDLVRGKIDRFTIDSLLNMLSEAGVPVEVRVGSGDIQSS